MSSQAQQQLISSLLNDLKNYSVNNKSFIPSELKSSDKKHKKSSSQHSQYAPSVDSLHSSETTTQPTLEYTPSPSAMQIVDNFVRLHPLTVSPSAQGTLLQHGVTDKLMSELIKIFTERINFIKHSSLNNFNIGHLIFANYLHLLLPCFEPCKFIAADFWNIFLKPVLFKCRWKNLVDLCSEIVLEMMTGEHFASLILRSIHIHADLLQSSGAMGTSTVAVLEFRNTVVLSYLKERIAVWDEIKLETDEKDVPSSSPGWETIAESNLEQVLNDFGMLCPKDFFALFAEFCIKPEYRLQTLLLLCRFVKREVCSPCLSQIIRPNRIDI
ncbi:hypothetical protein HK098_000418 [Nowakowskiella sp. JEL0407]|nr:hypothetical protein HK098_000418 [Nowakowskiella sp. JEL0407]